MPGMGEGGFWSCGVGAGVGGEKGGCCGAGDLEGQARGDGVVRGDCDQEGDWLCDTGTPVCGGSGGPMPMGDWGGPTER